MLYFVRKKVINVYVYRMDGKNYRITEEMHYQFNKKHYILKKFKMERLESLKGGEEND